MIKPPSFHSASDDQSTVAYRGWEAFRETAEASKQRKAPAERLLDISIVCICMYYIYLYIL